MHEHRLAKTDDRGVLDVMNGLTQLAEETRAFNGINDLRIAMNA